VSGWLDGLPLGPADKVTIAVHSILRRDQALVSIFGNRIYRRHVFTPSAQGAYPRLTVACVQIEETPAMSRILRGEPLVGILIEFEQWHEDLGADDSRSVASLLSYIQTLVDGAKATRLGVPEFAGLPLSNGKDWRWQTVRAIPDTVEGQPTAFFVGLELRIPVKTPNPSRQLAAA
jgi:hypothetical protein